MSKLKNWFIRNQEKIKAFLKKWIMFIFNPRFLICFLIGWLITNGWSYTFFAVGTFFGITWMTVVGTAYMSMLWAPFTPEKIITLFIAIFLLKLLFPKDEKTLKVLTDELEKAKAVFRRQNEKHRQKRGEKKRKKSKTKE